MTETITGPPEPGAAGADGAASELDPSPNDGVDDELDEAEETTAPPLSFDEFKLSEPIRRALVDVGYDAPMEVQAAVFTPVAEGRDIQVESRTGSGKTAAFGLPLIEKLCGEPPGVASLILAPTRELAKQVAEELKRLSVHTDVGVAAVYGGAAMGPQITALQAGVKIVAGTPGRVLDHIRRRNLDTSGIKTLILDECDEMLSMGFAEEIENIISTLPAKDERQTLLFSATIPDDIMRIAKRHLNDPVTISLSKDGIGAAEIDHHYYLVNGMARTRDLLKVVLREKPETAIIFCNTRDDTAVVARHLAKNGFDAEAISGDLSQRERERVMARMRAQNLRFLVATDIAARGIDISNLSHVINYQFPESAEVYVHRTGRTGRAGKKGTALSLVGPREIGSFYYLKLIYKIRPEERDLPPTEDFKEMLENHQLERVNKLVTEKPNEKFVSLAQRLMESEDGGRIVGALLERLLVAPTSVDRDRAEKREREEEREPRRSRSRRSERGGRDRDRDRDRGDDREPRRRRRRSERPDREASANKEDKTEETGDERGNTEAASAESRSKASDREASDREASDREASEREAGDREAGDQEASDLEGGESGATATSDGDGAPRKRRRRRRRGGRGRAEKSSEPRKASSGGDGREFWETWADEKSETGEDGEAAASEANGAGRTGEASSKVDAEQEDGETTARLYVNIGKREDATADDIRTLIGGLIGDDGVDQIDSVALRNTHSYVRVPDELVDGILKAAEGQAFRERELLVERARR